MAGAVETFTFVPQFSRKERLPNQSRLIRNTIMQPLLTLNSKHITSLVLIEFVNRKKSIPIDHAILFGFTARNQNVNLSAHAE